VDVRPVAPWRPSDACRETRPDSRPKRRIPGPLEILRTGSETLTVTGAVASSGLLGENAARMGSAMGSTLSGLTLAIGMVQVMSGASNGDKRLKVCGCLDLALGATGLAGGFLAMGGVSHPLVGVAALGLMGARIAYTVKNGSPF
jgi:hypothetical protein